MSADRYDDALSNLSPEQQAAMLAGHQEWIEQRELSRREAIEAMMVGHQCCADHNRDGMLRAERYGFEWQQEACLQHRQWPKIAWLIHGSGRGLTAGDFEAGAA